MAWKHENVVQGGQKKKKAAYSRTMAAPFLRGKQPEFPLHCIGTRKFSTQGSNVIYRRGRAELRGLCVTLSAGSEKLRVQVDLHRYD